MKRRPFITLATTILVACGNTTLCGVSSPVPDCRCPQSSFGWVLFEDSNRGVPDFWWQDSLEVQQIAVCRHGISFLFLAEEAGNLHVAALVFVNPSEEFLETRLGYKLYDLPFGRDIAHFKKRYSLLLSRLNCLWNGKFEAGGRIDFRSKTPGQRPLIIDPARRLILRWRSEEIELRGYLDVYFNSMT
jgi:hypothetical protein